MGALTSDSGRSPGESSDLTAGIPSFKRARSRGPSLGRRTQTCTSRARCRRHLGGEFSVVCHRARPAEHREGWHDSHARRLIREATRTHSRRDRHQYRGAISSMYSSNEMVKSGASDPEPFRRDVALQGDRILEGLGAGFGAMDRSHRAGRERHFGRLRRHETVSMKLCHGLPEPSEKLCRDAYHEMRTNILAASLTVLCR